MSLVVQKFGGTSVADPERLRNVARRVSETSSRGDDVVVVVSAMGRSTNRLVKLASEITEEPSAREMDVLLTTGEQVSIALLTMALHARGTPARSFTGGQVEMVTDTVHGRARIHRVDGQRIHEAHQRGEVAVVAGFQGITEHGEITTLGRGGSDLTAVALAGALGADVCEIYTDVDGVFTADPGIVPRARKLERISFGEMIEMASLGARVLQARSVEMAMRYGVPIHVRSSFKADEGTLVLPEEELMEAMLVSGVAHDGAQSKLSLLRVPDRPGVSARVFKALSEAGIVVDMIVQNVGHDGHADLSCTVPRAERERAYELLCTVARDMDAGGVEHDDDVAKVSVVGAGMRSHGGVAARAFAALADEGINIQMISTSEIAISCVIERKYTELAVRALHTAFGLDDA